MTVRMSEARVLELRIFSTTNVERMSWIGANITTYFPDSFSTTSESIILYAYPRYTSRYIHDQQLPLAVSLAAIRRKESTFSCQFNKTPVLYDAGCSIPLYRYFINISCESISNAFKCDVISVVLTAFNTSITLAVCWAWIVSQSVKYIVPWLGWELATSHRVDN